MGSNSDSHSDSDSNSDSNADSDSNANPDEDDGEFESGDPANAFAALGDPIRVGILEALTDHLRAKPPEPGLSFSTLRKRVDVRDSGRFRYHLEKLRGRFVEQTDDGQYRLTYAGTEVATAIVAGTYTKRATLGPTALESTCTRCDAQAVGAYVDGVLSVTCENDHPLFYWTLPPNAARGASLEAVIETATLDMYQTVEMTRSGWCPDCYTPVEARVESLEGGDGANAAHSYRFRAHCEACGSRLDGPLGFCLVGHPELEALYHRHGRSIREGYWWALEFANDGLSVERLGTDPLRLRLSFRVDDESFCATVDESAAVLETERRTD